MVGERSILRRRQSVRTAGAYTSEDAGMSNDKGSENLPRRKSKVSRVKIVFPGLVGP
jgi:hypothetical protein